MAVFYSFAGGLNRRGWYAPYDLWTHQWTSAEIEPDTPHNYIVDLSIAYDQTSGRYMAVAKSGTKILTCRFVRPPDALSKGEVIPLGWEVAAEHNPKPVDKPWIVAGEPNLQYGQEYYIVYQVDLAGYYHYLHSLDGGESWFPGVITVDDDPVGGQFCAQPAVYKDRPLYVAYIAGGTIYFLVGEDQPGGAVAFSRLLRATYPEPLPLSIPLASPVIRDDVPGDFVSPSLSTVPYLAVDPGDPDRLFIAYHDTATADPNDRDVNVYVRQITRDGRIWELGDRIKVNNDTTDYESDQFMPELIVDAAGYVHILFYDDRRFTDGPGYDLQPDDNCPQPKFDAYYAWAPVDNLDFEEAGRNLLLYLNNPSDPNEPAAFDRTLAPNANPREYNGIAWYGDRIWTAYTGTWADDPDNKTLIWSSRIDW